MTKMLIFLSVSYFTFNAYAIKVVVSNGVEIKCTTPLNALEEQSAKVFGNLQIVGTNPNSSDSMEGTLEVVLGSDFNPDFSKKDIFVKAVRMPNNSIQAFAMNAGLSMIYIDGESSYVEIGNKTYKSFCEVQNLNLVY